MAGGGTRAWRYWGLPCDYYRQGFDELVKRAQGVRFDPGHGRLMKEWLVVEKGKAKWVELAKEACEFVKRGN